jgi:hypothetical protein
VLAIELTDVLWKGLVEKQGHKSVIEDSESLFGHFFIAMEIVKQCRSGNIGRVTIVLIRMYFEEIR